MTDLEVAGSFDENSDPKAMLAFIRRIDIALRRTERTAQATALRRCAEEIENSMRNAVVTPTELLTNCVMWYRAQAHNLDDTDADRSTLRDGIRSWPCGCRLDTTDARRSYGCATHFIRSLAQACEWCGSYNHDGLTECPRILWKLDTEERREFVRFIRRTADEWRANEPEWSRRRREEAERAER